MQALYFQRNAPSLKLFDTPANELWEVGSRADKTVFIGDYAAPQGEETRVLVTMVRPRTPIKILTLADNPSGSL